MIEGKSVLAIITARGGSKGLPRKNIRMLHGKPLVAWPISAAKNSKYVDRIFVSTDDEKIAKVVEAEGIEVPFLRPKEIAADNSPTISVIEHLIGRLRQLKQEFDYCVLLEPTSPLTDSDDINKAILTLNSNRSKADSIVGVAENVSTHPVFSAEINKDGLITPFIGDDFSSAGRRQDIEKIYYFEGSLYISDVKILLERKSFYHHRTLPYIVPKWKALEIDDMMDFLCVETIMKNIEILKESDR